MYEVVIYTRNGTKVVQGSYDHVVKVREAAIMQNCGTSGVMKVGG
jgi:hypothetical protein